MMKMGLDPYLPLLSYLAIYFLIPGCDAFDCPGGWLKHGAYCYGFFSNKMDWTQAELACQRYSKSGHLASILWEQEAALIADHILNHHPTIETFWIGLRDRLKNGRWRWADASTSTLTAWVDGKPKDVNESGFCAYISRKQDFRKWNDTFCNTPMSYICELGV